MSNQYIGEVRWNNDWIPQYWEKYGLTIVSDGFTEFGMRVHIVEGDVAPTIKDNALVMSLGYLGEG